MTDDDVCSSVGSLKEHDLCNECPTETNRSWTREELKDLYYMSYQNHTIQEMCNEFGRPKKQIIKALRRLQAQQCMFHPIEEVAIIHNMSTETLTKRLKDPLYYMPINTDGIHPIIIITSVVFGLVSLYGYTCYKP